MVHTTFLHCAGRFKVPSAYRRLALSELSCLHAAGTPTKWIAGVAALSRI